MPNGNPNTLILWGDDIGITSLSCYSDGMMGRRTPVAQSLGEFPRRQEPASFTIDKVIAKIEAGVGSS